MASCATCGQPLSLKRRILGATKCEDCERTAAAARDQATAAYEPAVGAVIRAGGASGPEVSHLRQLEDTISAGGGKVADRKLAAWSAFVDSALADEVLTEEEENRILAVGEALYRTPEVVSQLLAPLRPRLFVAMVNSGRLPTVDSGGVILKKGEIAHLQERASLLKEVVQREYRGSSTGYSFRIMKGVYYRTGAQRGHMVEVGRSWQPEDDGVLVITSHRAVFTGTRRSVEMSYAKLLNMNVFADAIQIHVSNRQKPTTIRVSSGDMVAAAINAAMQRLLG